MVAIATSHGSSIRRRASLNTQYAHASQNTTRKRIPRFRITNHVSESKKSPTRVKTSSEVVVVASAKRMEIMASQQELSDDVPHSERDSCTRGDHDGSEDIDAHPRPVVDGTSSPPAAR